MTDSNDTQDAVQEFEERLEKRISEKMNARLEEWAGLLHRTLEASLKHAMEEFVKSRSFNAEEPERTPGVRYGASGDKNSISSHFASVFALPRVDFPRLNAENESANSHGGHTTFHDMFSKAQHHNTPIIPTKPVSVNESNVEEEDKILEESIEDVVTSKEISVTTSFTTISVIRCFDMLLRMAGIVRLGEIDWNIENLRVELVVVGRRHVLRGASYETKIELIGSSSSTRAEMLRHSILEISRLEVKSF